MQTEKSRPSWFAEKQLPNDIDAEIRVLKCIMDDGFDVGEIDFLKPEDFFHRRHRIIFKIILELYAKQEPIFAYAVQEEIERAGHHLDGDFQDNRFYTMNFSSETCVLDPTKDARYIHKLAICRSIARGVTDPVKLAYDGEAEQAIEALAQLAYKFHTNDDQKNEPVAVSNLSTSFVENLTRLCDRKGQVIGVGTGFTDFDSMTGGLQKSDLIILAARPAIGKTSMALSIARNASAKFKQGIAIFSLEMSREQLYQRLIAMEAGIDQQRLRTGWIDDEDWEKIVGAIERINNMSIYIDDSAAVTPDEIRNKVRRLITSGVDIGLIVVDYLQLMSLPGKSKNTNREQEVSEISRQLKGVARELDMPVLSLAQLSRAVETRQSKIPQMSDLRESGGLENNADIVLFLYRDDVYNPETERPNIADLIVAKHRNGPVGTVSLYFEKSQTKFSNLYVTTPVEQ